MARTLARDEVSPLSRNSLTVGEKTEDPRRRLPGSTVGREQMERLAARSSQRAEVPLVEGEYARCAVALGQHHVGGVGQADVLVPVAFDHLCRPGQVFGPEGFEGVSASGNVSMKPQFSQNRGLRPPAVLRRS